MSWFANGWSGLGARSGMGPIDRVEGGSLYARSLDEFFLHELADSPRSGGFSEELEQRPELRHQVGDMERFVVDDMGDVFPAETDVVVSLPGGELPQAVASGDSVELWTGVAPNDTFGGGDSSDWMLTLLPSADWFDFRAPAADPWA